MSIAFTIRVVLLMMLMPDTDGRHAMGTLLGDLLAVPWRREHAVPSGTVLSRWRTAIGYPQIRSLHANDTFTRAGQAVVTGPAGGDKAEAEQKLLDRMLIEYAPAFTENRLWIMDRNFPGVPRITRIIAKTTDITTRIIPAQTHVCGTQAA